MNRTRKSNQGARRTFRGKHRFEHWYRDNQVYFITARCRNRYPAFASELAKTIFWDRFDYYTQQAGFVTWVVSLMDNHYHMLGYNRSADCLGPMMRKLHGSVSKLVNDTLPCRHLPFWREAGHRDYFDGCIRDENQCRKAYAYTLRQSEHHGVCSDWRDYAGTKVRVDLDAGVKRALELQAFLEGVPYRRYSKQRGIPGSVT